MIPTTLDGVMEWLATDAQRRRGRAFVVNRPTVPGVNGAVKQIVIRLQGVVSNVNLKFAGSWDGYVVIAYTVL